MARENATGRRARARSTLTPAQRQGPIEPERTKSATEKRASSERKARKRASPSPRRSHRIDTDCGPLTVTVVGDLSNPKKILTYHDICAARRLRSDPCSLCSLRVPPPSDSDHRTAFNTFFQAAEGNELLSDFTVLHVDAPGHEEGAEARHLNVRRRAQRKTCTARPLPRRVPTPRSLPAQMPYPSAEELAEQLCAVVEQLKLGRCGGGPAHAHPLPSAHPRAACGRSFAVIGCGYGANVLARYCALQPQQVSAAILVGLHTGKASIVDSVLFPVISWLARWQETLPTVLRARIRGARRPQRSPPPSRPHLLRAHSAPPLCAQPACSRRTPSPTRSRW